MRIFLLTTIALVSGPLWSQAVYRSVDESGTVSYSDRPQGENVEEIFIAVRSSANRPAPRQSASSGTQPQAAEQASQQPGQQAEAAGLTEEEIAQQRAENCRIATERLERYTVSHRLYRNLPNGEREYLSDAEIDDARATAAADVEEWCD